MIQIENRKFEIFPLVMFTVYYFSLIFKIGILMKIVLSIYVELPFLLSAIAMIKIFDEAIS